MGITMLGFIIWKENVDHVHKYYIYLSPAVVTSHIKYFATVQTVWGKTFEHEYQQHLLRWECNQHPAEYRAGPGRHL